MHGGLLATALVLLSVLEPALGRDALLMPSVAGTVKLGLPHYHAHVVTRQLASNSTDAPSTGGAAPNSTPQDCPVCVHPAAVAVPTAAGTLLAVGLAWLIVSMSSKHKRSAVLAGLQQQQQAQLKQVQVQVQMALADVGPEPDGSPHGQGLSTQRVSSRRTTFTGCHGGPDAQLEGTGPVERSSQPTGASRVLHHLSGELYLDRSTIIHPAQGIDATRQGLLAAAQQQHGSASHDVLDSIELIATLGEGTYGRVYKANWKGIIVAVKVMELTGSEKRERMAVMEAAISSSLSHPNIVQTYTCAVRPLSGTPARTSRCTSRGRTTPASARLRMAPAAPAVWGGSSTRLFAHSMPGSNMQPADPGSPAHPTAVPAEQLTNNPSAPSSAPHALVGEATSPTPAAPSPKSHMPPASTDAAAAAMAAAAATPTEPPRHDSCTGLHSPKAHRTGALSGLAMAAMLGSARMACGQGHSAHPLEAHPTAATAEGSAASGSSLVPQTLYVTSPAHTRSHSLPQVPTRLLAAAPAAAASPQLGNAPGSPVRPASRSRLVAGAVQGGAAGGGVLGGETGFLFHPTASGPMELVSEHAAGVAALERTTPKTQSERMLADGMRPVAGTLGLVRVGSAPHGEVPALGPTRHGASLCVGGAAALGSQLQAASEQDGLGTWEVQLVQEFCEAGSLRDLLDKGGFASAGGRVDLRALLETAMDVARALEHLHTQHIVHSDLKPRNVLLKANPLTARGFIAKVADFGLSVRIDPDHAHMTNVFQGTLSHMAPEVLVHGQLGKPADVFAFGTMLWEMYTGERPFRGMPKSVLVESIIKHGIRPTFPLHVPPGLAALAQQCWALNPAARPTFTEVLRTLQELWQAATQLGSLNDDAVALAGAAQPTHLSGSHSGMARGMQPGKLPEPRLPRSSCPHRALRCSAAVPAHAHSATPLPKLQVASLHTAALGAQGALGPLLLPSTSAETAHTGASRLLGTLATMTPASGGVMTPVSGGFMMSDPVVLASQQTSCGPPTSDALVCNWERGSSLLHHNHTYGSEMQAPAERSTWVQVPPTHRGLPISGSPAAVAAAAGATGGPGSPMRPSSRLCNMQLAYLSLVPEHMSSSAAPSSPASLATAQQQLSTPPGQGAPALSPLHRAAPQVQAPAMQAVGPADDDGSLLLTTTFSGSFALKAAQQGAQVAPAVRTSPTALPRSSGIQQPAAVPGASVQAPPGAPPVPGPSLPQLAPMPHMMHDGSEVPDHRCMGGDSGTDQLAELLLQGSLQGAPPAHLEHTCLAQQLLASQAHSVGEEVWHSTGFAGVVPASAGYHALLQSDALLRTLGLEGVGEEGAGQGAFHNPYALPTRASAKSHYLEDSCSEDALSSAEEAWHTAQQQSSASQRNPAVAPAE